MMLEILPKSYHLLQIPSKIKQLIFNTIYVNKKNAYL